MAVSTYPPGQTLPPGFQEQLPDADRLKEIILTSTVDWQAGSLTRLATAGSWNVILKHGLWRERDNNRRREGVLRSSLF